MAQRRDGRSRTARRSGRFSNALGAAYRRIGRLLLTAAVRGRDALLLAVLWLRRTAAATAARVATLLAGWRAARMRTYPYYRHSLPVRIMHWANLLFVAILLMSGLNILSAHPALYWGISSYRGVPPVLDIRGEVNDRGEVVGITRILGRDFDTTGFMGASRGPFGHTVIRDFPSWLTIPDARWLAMARRWHFFFAWLFVLNGIAFVTYSIASRHVQRDLIPTGKGVRSIGSSILDHLRFRHPAGEASKHYNVLQKSTYLGVIFLLLPLMVLMGLGMSPALDTVYPGWVDLFSGRQSVRTVHFAVACALVLFTAVHVFEVIVTGFWNNLRSMITGYYRVRPEAGREK